MALSNDCECGDMTIEECQCDFLFDASPWELFDQDDIEWGEEGEAPWPDMEPVLPESE